MYIAFGDASDRDRIETREIGPAAPAVAPSPDYFYTLCLKLGPLVLVRCYVDSEIRSSAYVTDSIWTLTAFAYFELKGKIYGEDNHPTSSLINDHTRRQTAIVKVSSPQNPPKRLINAGSSDYLSYFSLASQNRCFPLDFSVTTSPLPPALSPTLVPRAPSDQPGAPDMPAKKEKMPRDQRVKLWIGNYDDSGQPLPLSAPLEQRKKANPAICYGTLFCLFYGKDGKVHNVGMKKKSSTRYYVELPALLHPNFRRYDEQQTALVNMMDVAQLLKDTNTPKEALNQKSYIPTTVKFNLRYLSPPVSEAEFENVVSPKIAHVVTDLLESEDPIESISDSWELKEAVTAAVQSLPSSFFSDYNNQ
ncbi:hypothetical protein FB446DRAFT_707581 [Lentinula raphanica]|nr:hypothetical protein FB446DRAFT_707581 [Lentinula raphanica]